MIVVQRLAHRSFNHARSPMAETNRPRSSEETTLLERARRRLPGGVLGTSRYADEAAFVVKRGQGSKIYDVSGREYIDYVLASGPLVLGHAHPAVVAAVRSQIEGGSTYFMVNEPIIELAEEICRAVPRQGPEIRGWLPRGPRLLDDERVAALAQGLPGARAGLLGHSPRARGR